MPARAAPRDRPGPVRALLCCAAALCGCAPAAAPDPAPGAAARSAAAGVPAGGGGGGGAAAPSVAAAAPVAVDRAACASEAVLLTGPVSVLPAPAPGAAAVRSLPPRAPVYLCGTSGGYRGVMFPAPGQRAVCGRRGADAACPTGWVREPLPYEVAG